MTLRILALLREHLDTSVVQPVSWAEAWITMDATGTGNDRELPLFETAQPSDASAIFMLLGRDDDDPKAGNRTPAVVANWVRMGLSAKGIDVAVASDVSAAQASRVRTAWEEDIRSLLADAACIGLTGQEIYDAVTIPGYFPEHITNRLVALRESREDALVPTAEEEIRDAWRSFRENASRQGLAPDHFDVDPPHWFVKRIS